MVSRQMVTIDVEQTAANCFVRQIKGELNLSCFFDRQRYSKNCYLDVKK